MPDLNEVSLSAGDKTVEMPVLQPTLGQPCIDIARLPKETGCFTYDNGFKIQWEDFIRHVVAGTPWTFDLVEGAKGVQLAELGLKSWTERRWLDVPDLKI